MKHTLIICLMVLMMSSCKREAHNESTVDLYLNEVIRSLKDSLSATDFQSLDFTRSIVTSVDSVDLHIIRIPIKFSEVSQQFLLAKTKKDGKIEQGQFVQLKLEIGRRQTSHQIKGKITLSTLDRRSLRKFTLENGILKRWYDETDNLAKETPVYQTLPEVVVISTYGSATAWMNLAALVGGYSSSGGGYYSELNYQYSGGRTGGVNTGTNQPITHKDTPILIDQELQGDRQKIEIEKYLNCFNTVPDEGSKCSITLLVDIPVDSDPNKLLDANTGSPGHAFISITKTNGDNWVTQNIGFYPETGWKVTITNAPVNGKFVDNEGHEFNASIKMDLDANKLKSILINVGYLARNSRYDIDEYNCTDFALDVFNFIRSDKINIPLYHIPGGITAAGTRTPQGLYNKLKEMKANGHPEAQNITTDIYKGWAGGSKGPCN